MAEAVHVDNLRRREGAAAVAGLTTTLLAPMVRVGGRRPTARSLPARHVRPEMKSQESRSSLQTITSGRAAGVAKVAKLANKHRPASFVGGVWPVIRLVCRASACCGY